MQEIILVQVLLQLLLIRINRRNNFLSQLLIKYACFLFEVIDDGVRQFRVLNYRLELFQVDEVMISGLVTSP